MVGNSLKRRLLAAVLAMSLLILPAAAVHADSLSDNQQRQEELKQKSQELDAQLEQARQKTADQQAQRDALAAKIEVVQQQIDTSNATLNGLDTQISAKEEEIAGKQEEIDGNFDLLKERIRAIYMAGETSTLDLLLGAESFNDLLDKTQVLKSITEHDMELINGLKSSMAEIQAEKDEIEAQRTEAAQVRKDLESQQQELTQLLEENDALLAQLEGEEQAIKDELDQNDAELQQIEAEIQQYYQQYQQQSSGQSTQNQGQATTPVYQGGRYVWPTPGFTSLSSTWGDGRNHGAIDIAGSGIYGTQVVAAASGTVVHAESGGWGGGYGSYIIIDHGSGRATLYAHLSGVVVTTGQTVQQGQLIGYVGNTGRSSGPHLHFETRLNGVKYDPMTEF